MSMTWIRIHFLKADADPDPHPHLNKMDPEHWISPDPLMIPWWSLDDPLMIPLWSLDDPLMIPWWWTEQGLILIVCFLAFSPIYL